LISRRQLATVEKLAYLAAEKCLFQRPAKLNKFPGAKTRYDELVALHQIMALQIHSTGQFLPYHRYYVKVHQALLKECGYYGTMP
jgi:tyrosinase